MSQGHHRAAELGVGDVKAGPKPDRFGSAAALYAGLCRLQATTRAVLGASEGPKSGDWPFSTWLPAWRRSESIAYHFDAADAFVI